MSYFPLVPFVCVRAKKTKKSCFLPPSGRGRGPLKKKDLCNSSCLSKNRWPTEPFKQPCLSRSQLWHGCGRQGFPGESCGDLSRGQGRCMAQARPLAGLLYRSRGEGENIFVPILGEAWDIACPNPWQMHGTWHGTSHVPILNKICLKRGWGHGTWDIVPPPRLLPLKKVVISAYWLPN